ncbi:MAG: hypothetical protein JRN29_06165, partial [Nitrososphaerota archaeon]|nr:hypothetical protein [Nitrososphaerota archaeon]
RLLPHHREGFGLFKKGWIDEESWEEWNSWLKVIASHPQFAMMHSSTEGMYDRGFQAHASALLEPGPASD